MMEDTNTSDLYDQSKSKTFYENRYISGYMETWPIEREERLLDVIAHLDLPVTGKALDFGCGNGVGTDTLRRILPSWTVYGTDISETAISNASVRYPSITFFNLEDIQSSPMKFDLVFSNHLLEHVYDLEAVVETMNLQLKDHGVSMLHVLPCRSPGSYEHSICQLRSDGIAKERGNRYFFEDQGHLRRLSTDDLSDICHPLGFHLSKEFYSYHYFGSIDWITTSVKTVLTITDGKTAIDSRAKRELIKQRLILLSIALLRTPAIIVPMVLRRSSRKLKHYIVLILSIPLYVFSLPVHLFFKWRAKAEWASNKYDRTGSEMWLHFRRI